MFLGVADTLVGCFCFVVWIPFNQCLFIPLYCVIWWFHSFTTTGTYPIQCVRGRLHEKLAPARVSYWDDFLIHIAFTWWLGHFISRYLTEHFMLIKYMCDSKLQTSCMHYPFQSTGRPVSHRNMWSFCIYMIPLQDFVLEWNSRPGTRTRVNSHQGDARRHDILW